MTKAPIRLIVGLGNPGSEHREDRHNAGYWFVDALARKLGGQFRPERKFSGEVARVNLAGQDLRLLKPDTFMNRSGTSVQALAGFLKIPTGEILVAHDELDLPVGTARLKRGGGAGGHNGLRDVIQQLGADFARLRIGIGHPGDARKVTSYVLRRPPADELGPMEDAIRDAVTAMDLLMNEGFEKAMHRLHSRGKTPRPYRKQQSAGESGEKKDTPGAHHAGKRGSDPDSERG